MEKIKNGVDKIKKERSQIQKEVKQNLAKYIGAAFGLVAGLAWNDAIKALIEYLFPIQKNGLLAKFIYAALITLVVVFITTYFVKLLKREEGENKK